MTQDQSPRSRLGWLNWLRFGPDETDDQSDVGGEPRTLTPREVWLPAKRRFLAQITDFLIDHDLEVLPFTLAVAHDCVSGANPRLAQAILERAEKGLPISLGWLEELHAGGSRDAQAEAVADMVDTLERNVCTLGTTTSDMREVSSSYSHALEGHIAELGHARHADNVLQKLTVLGLRMLDHVRGAMRTLETSEAHIASLQAQLDEARRLAHCDHLTGLPNRRAFDATFDREMAVARAAGEPLCVAFCDIDHFKRINDAHGHPAGDRVLRFVAETLGRIADARCHVARHGGEEFAVLLRGTTPAEAWARLDAAREEIAAKRLVNRVTDVPFGRITFSGGIAEATAHADRSAALKAADNALIAAKAAGRNRIVVAGVEPEPLRAVA